MKHWQIVAHMSELAHEGDYLCLPWKVNGELAIMRNADGTMTAFDNRCPHRGARIFTNLRGNRPPVCGYHGRCAKPNEVKRFDMATILGWVVVRDAPPLDPEGFVPPPWYETFRRLVPRAGMLDSKAVDVTYHSTVGPMDYACHWTVAVENTLDREHILTVHVDTLAPLGLISKTVRTFPDGSSLEEFEATDRQKVDRLRDLFRDPSDIDYFHLSLFPHTALSSTAGTSYSLQHYFPRADGSTLFVSRLYGTPPKNFLATEHFLDSVHRFNAKVFKEDAHVCALVPPFHNGRLQPNEARIGHFREFARS